MLRKSELPPLSWLLRIEHDSASLECGWAVETRDQAFFEGAWAGDFEMFGISECANVFGSGGKLSDEGVTLVPPSHTLDGIYLMRTRNGWLCSNSLAFLLETAGASLEFTYPESLHSFMRIVHGIGEPAQISTSSGPLYIVRHHNVIVNENIFTVPKPATPSFGDYAEYRDYLTNTVDSIADNGSRDERRAKYSLLTTVSAGYDSPACAAIARTCGCRHGVTIKQTRDGSPDDGTEIGAHLGLEIKAYDHPLLTGSLFEDADTAAQFFATGMHGMDITQVCMRDALAGRLLLTGYHGDKIWSRTSKPNRSIIRGDLSGSSLGEFRLSANFIHLPVPFIGAMEHDSIHRISNSEEMKPYRIGGRYDRPIPRRIVEEAGVPRALFGYRKGAVTSRLYAERQQWPRKMRLEIARVLRSKGPTYRVHFDLKVLRWRLVMSCLRLSRYVKLRPVLKKIRRQLFGEASDVLIRHGDPYQLLVLEWALDCAGRRYAGDKRSEIIATMAKQTKRDPRG